MEPGELGEPVQEQECSAVPVSKDLPGAGEYASNGLFGLRFMGGPWFVQGCLLRQRGEGEGAVTPVSEERKQGKKSEAAT